MTSLRQVVQNMFSNNSSNIMLAAIISLLLVILFVLLLHLYAQWFLSHAHHSSPRHRLRRPSSAAIAPARFHRFHSFHHSPFPFSPTSKGLTSSTISKIPLFVYKRETLDHTFDDLDILECVICLSVFEDGENGRMLPKCGHAFHVDCIDMWLTSHCSCPICRSPVLDVVASVLEDADSSSSPVLDVVVDSIGSEISEIDRATDHHSVISVSVSTTNDDHDDDHHGDVGESVISISETSSSNLLGCSLKRMFCKVFPSSNVNELGTS